MVFFPLDTDSLSFLWYYIPGPTAFDYTAILYRNPICDGLWGAAYVTERRIFYVLQTFTVWSSLGNIDISYVNRSQSWLFIFLIQKYINPKRIEVWLPCLTDHN